MLPSLIAVAILFDTPAKASAAAAMTPPRLERTAQPPQVTPDRLTNVSVRLRCIARSTGAVSDCTVVSETLPGYGFGETAVALMNGATVEPPTDAGRPVDAVFERTIEFMP